MTDLIGQFVHIFPPVTPPNVTKKTIYADDPLEIDNQTSPHSKEYVITNGKIFYIQRIKCTAGNDPSNKGSRIEIIYDANGTEHIFERSHVSSSPFVEYYANKSETRDGTSMIGNAGGTNKIIIRRTQLSGTAHEVDVVIDGFEV